MRRPAALLALPLLLPIAAAPPPPAGPIYEVRLDEREPRAVRFTLVDAAANEAQIVLRPTLEALLASGPACGATPLVRSGPGHWTRPAGCAAISWTARLDDADRGMDSTRPPPGAWSRRHSLWLLTGGLPWLGVRHQGQAVAHISARLGGRLLSRDAAFRSEGGTPLYLAIGTPVHVYRAGGFTTRVYGDAPAGARADRLQLLAAETFARWRRDVVPVGEAPTKRLDMVWVAAPAGAAPGFFASASASGVLMQYVPDPRASDGAAKLEAGIALSGMHEGFHALGEWISGARPEWVNESWATFFAWEAARRHLRGAAFARASALVDEPSDVPILQAQREVSQGDQTHYGVFYGKGAHFWAAIEAVLDGPANGSGRLAALIRTSQGMKGVDWSSAESITTWLDAHSHGRAGPIVHCYLIENGCPATASPRHRGEASR